MANRRSRRSSRHKHRHITPDPKPESQWAQRPARRPVPEAEKLLLSFLIAVLILLPWALGTAHFWTQAAAGLLAFVCLIVSLIPHDFNDNPADTAAKRLLAFPVFWLGVALLVYVGFQVFNPGYQAERADSLVWLSSSDAVGFLPSGVRASLFEQGSLRSLLVLSIPFFTICAMWAGVTRRRSCYILLWVLVLNGVSLAGAAVAQAYTRTKEVLWFFPRLEGEPFISSFLHAPHAAAFFLALTGPALGLGAHYYFQAKKTFERSNPSGLFAFSGIVFFLMLLFSYQPAGAACAAFLLLFLLYFILHREFLHGAPRFQKALFFGLGLIVMTVGGSMAWNVVEAHVERRTSGPPPPIKVVEESDETGEEAVEAETAEDGEDAETDAPAEEAEADAGESEADAEEAPAEGADAVAEPGIPEEPAASQFAAGFEMFQEHWLFGAGAGSFSYLFPEYADLPPPERPENPVRIVTGNDWIRVPAELGLAGSLLIAVLVLSLVARTLRRRLLENPVPLFTLLGLAAVVLLSGTRVVFDNPAVVTTWLGLLTVSALIIRVETSRVVPEGKSGLKSE